MTTFCFNPFWSNWSQSLIESRYAMMQRFHVRIIVPPIEEPITLEEAAQHLRLDILGEDSPPAAYPDEDLILEMISAAREYCEHYIGRSIAKQTLELRTSRFTSTIALPLGPVVSVTQVSYIDKDGNEIILSDIPVDSPASSPPDLADYVLDNFSEPAVLRLPYGGSWPTDVRGDPDGVRIQYVVGYSLPTDSPIEGEPLPKSIKAAIKLYLGHLYENREATAENPPQELVLSLKALLDPYRQRSNFA